MRNGLRMLLLGILLVTMFGAAHAQFVGMPATPNSVTITTTGTAEADPDRVDVKMAVEGRGVSAQDALVACQGARDRALGNLSALGIAAETVRMTPPRFSEAGFMGMGDESANQRYTASMVLTVRIAPVNPDSLHEEIASIIDAVAGQAGGGPRTISSISDIMSPGDIVTYGVEDPTPLRNKAIADAVQKARTLAEAAAAASGCTVGPVSSIQMMDPGMQGLMAMISVLAEPGMPGRAVYSLTVSVTFDLVGP